MSRTNRQWSLDRSLVCDDSLGREMLDHGSKSVVEEFPIAIDSLGIERLRGSGNSVMLQCACIRIAFVEFSKLALDSCIYGNRSDLTNTTENLPFGFGIFCRTQQ